MGYTHISISEREIIMVGQHLRQGVREVARRLGRAPSTISREIARNLLKKLGLRVTLARNGEEALALATGHAFDIALMDCQMPVMNGYEATAALRAREAAGGPRLPVIAMTADALEGDRERCLAAGMDDYLAKPYTRAQLDAMLRRWLGGDTRPGAPGAQPGAA